MRKIRQFTADEDAPLLTAWHCGDIAAFETLIWKYQKRIFNLVLQLTGIHKAACEAAENTFLTAYQNIKAKKSTVRFSSWLVSIALKECRELNDHQPQESESPPGHDMTLPDEGSYTAAMHRKLELCIRALPVELAELILLRYVRGYSLDRMEEILQVNGELLLTRMFTAQETLARWLKSDGEPPAGSSVPDSGDSALHPEIRRTFSAYLDNSTEGDDKELTKSHLKSCGSCREALAELEWMIEDIKNLPDVEPPNWLASAIMAKVKSVPAKAVSAKAPSRLRLQLTAAALLIAVIAISSYLLLNRSGPTIVLPRSGNIPAPSQPAVKGSEPAAGDFSSLIKGVFKGAVTSPDTPSKPEQTSRPSVPLPPASPSEQLLPPAQSTKASQTPGMLRSEPAQKSDRTEGVQSLPPEWGEALPPLRSPQKKAAPRGGGELAVVLNTADPAAAISDIENAVTTIGGRITGRAYSNGSDVLYTRVEVDRFFELMSRLGRVGKIQELPQLPEGAAETLDLTIRW